MVNRREFLATAVASACVANLAEAKTGAGASPAPDFNTLAPSSPAEQPGRFPPGSVKVGGEMGRRINITAKSNLLAINTEEDFLQPLREHKQTGGYYGLGKLIDASVQFSQATGDPEILKFKKWLVAETLKTQGRDGYIGYLASDKRMWELWDLSEMGYIVYGLSMDHRLYGETASRDAARKLADYILARWTAEPSHVFGDDSITPAMPMVGIHNAMLAIYQETQDARYLSFVRDFLKTPEWDGRIVLGRWGKIEGHAYTYLAHCIGQLRLDRVSPDPRLAGPSSRILDFMLNHDGMTITGAVGDHECWHDTQEGTLNLGETCATVYAIFWLDELMQRHANSKYGDLMERLIHNSLFGAQSPEGRRLRYYTAFDGPRHYFEKDTYCCPNNYRRALAMLPNLIYYRRKNGVAVNLYTASNANLTLDGGLQLKLEQKTEYPASGQVALTVDPSRPASFPLWLRIPSWCGEPRIIVNEQSIHAPAAGQFLVLDRPWKAGDQVNLDMPMVARWVKGRRAQAGHVALMHGPQLFCLNRHRHPELKDVNLRLLVIDPATLEGPFPDDAVRPGGKAFRVRAWKPGAWYPLEKADFTLTLSEFADPDGEATFFKVPNPGNSQFVADELLGIT